MNSSTLNQIANNILNIMRGGRSSNNDIISIDQIKFLVKYYRSLLIRRDQERNMNRSRLFEQDLGQIECEIIDSVEDFSTYSWDEVVRTKKRIPTPIRLKNSEAITYVSAGNKIGEPLPVLDAHIAYWQNHGKYTSTKPFAFYRDGYIYVVNDDFMESVHVRGVFEDPEEVFNFSRLNGLEIYDDNSPYPISTDMIENITKSILSGEGSALLTSPNNTELNKVQQ